ncbi:MAG: Phosphodiesterase/alkaline phosphatase, partial [Myxococcaceae bacterium]|nr:Phosphodiesterase/alkaline phosphatase [Myxococcaceae bacterium]
ADAGVDAGVPVENPETLTESAPLFGFGIAAGDALADRIILQTRYAGLEPLRLRVWRMEGGTYAEQVADAPVTPVDGGFVHLDVQGLTPGARYRYAFVHGAAGQPLSRSPIGRFRAALGPGQSEPLIFGAVSCTQNAIVPRPLARAAERDDLDAFLLLGDTTYNDGATTLAEYRAKWAQGLSRPEYRALRASVGLVATWDDHEVTNDFNPETIAASKLAAARQSYFEALPLRRDAIAPDRLWKSIRWGSTAELFVLDGRGERKPSTLLNGQHIYLSREQMDWFKAALKASPCTFKVILNSVPISDFGFSAFNPDGWRAYQNQRLEILSYIDDEAIGGVLWVAGDHHFASCGTVSPSGPGSTALEVLAGPGGQSANALFNLLTKPRWEFASGENNYLAIHCLPATKEYRLVFHDGDGKTLFEKKVAV